MQALERYYTPASVAEHLVSLVHPEKYSCIIEPSAGDGAILKALTACGTPLPPIYAYDLSPAAEGITEMNWLEPRDRYGTPRKKLYIPAAEKARLWHHALVIGNPPFSKAESFIRESLFADAIAFILPKSFMKSGHAERIIGAHHYVQVIEEIPETARYRLPDGQTAAVPTCMCVFQWQATERQETPLTHSENFIFMKDPEKASFAIIRVGGKAGTVLTLEEAAAYSHETVQYVRGDPSPFYAAETVMQHMAEISTGAKIINQREICESILLSESTACI
jgi:hypothetical protein